MPITKTAKRALRGSAKKQAINILVTAKLEAAVRLARKIQPKAGQPLDEKSRSIILKAISLADQAAKKKVVHKNKAARIKSSLSKSLPKGGKKSKKIKKISKK